MDQIGPNRSKWTEWTQQDWIDQSRPNGFEWIKPASNRPNWIELTEVDRMDQIELKWTEVDQIGPKLTQMV